MKKLIEYLREWSEDYNAAQKELNDMGLFTAYHQWGSYVHYTDPTLTKHINNTDDKQDTISKNNR
jgi:hypothetical protein